MNKSDEKLAPTVANPCPAAAPAQAPAVVSVPLYGSGILGYTLTTALAAAFNMLILLVILFGVIPNIERATSGGERNLEAVEKNGEALQEMKKEIEYFRVVIQRLNNAIDAAEAKAKAASKKP